MSEPQTSLFSPSLLAGYLVFSWVKYSTVGVLGENYEDLILFPRPPPDGLDLLQKGECRLEEPTGRFQALGQAFL